MKDEDFKNGLEDERKKIVEVFCRETAYVLVGRLLFIRMCEDKDILEQSLSGKRFAEFLRFYEKRKENVYLRAFYDSREEIKKYYGHLHELGFFDWWIIEEMKKGTLSYKDNRVQADLEGDLDYNLKGVFRKLNRFDFAKVNRDILGDVYQGYLPPKERKQLGEFYTPIEVIEYILDAVEYAQENEIRGKTVLDPACGSGGFLVEATQRLVERYKRKGFNLKDPDYAKQVIEGCINSIYGLDLHPFACFIAEMNLLFQLVELYDVVRQKYKYYELPRINVYRTDSLAPYGGTTDLTDFFENSRRKMLIQEMKEAETVKKIKFDYIVGNPPYVRKERISPDYKEKVLKTVFPKIYHGDNDLYVYFIAKGIEQLKENGTLGYIISSKFLKTRYGQNIRDFILSSSRVKQFLDFGLIDVFKEVANLPIILILEKESDEKRRGENKLKVTIAKKEKGYARDLVKHVRERIEKGPYSDDFIDVFDLSQTSLGRQAWKLIPSYVSDTLQKIKDNSDYPLGKICRVYYCVKTGLNRLGKQGVLVVTKEDVDESNLETALLRPVLRGEDVRKFKVDYKGYYLIFPYIREEIDGQSQYKVVDIQKYPNLHHHLNKFKENLAKRSDIRKTDSEWYELRPCNYYHVFESEKIITPDISRQNNFAYDDGKYFCLDSCFVISLKDVFKKDLKEKSSSFLKYLLGLLNSKLLEFYFRQTSTFVLGRHYRYKVEYLEPLQIKAITDTNRVLTKKIIDAVNQILLLNEKSDGLSRKLAAFPRSYFGEGWRFDKLADTIKSQNLSRESYSVSAKSLRTDYKQRDLDGSETFRIILATNEFIDLGSEEVASYVLDILKTMNRITKRELLEIEIPEQQHLKSLLSQCRCDKNQVVKNEKAVAEWEKQIENLVYAVYNINQTERRVIEKYLEKS
ncbi:N-6 DNA methylase [Candidatus Bathyarchaeota archaeon]|nr:N-6 DNA methylase [Candidatus Bathyarchaeota archaeon]